MVKSIQDGPLLLSKNDYLIAGSVSGLVSRAIVQPLDVLKIRFQLQAEPICACDTSKYHGFIQAIRCISKEEGTVAFWKGHIPAQLQAIAFSAVQFLSFEVFVAWLPALGARNDPRLAFSSSSPFQTFACGCLAGGVAACTTQPLDVLRTRFIAQGEPKFYRSLSHATLYIASHEGWSGYFRGLVPSILLVAPQTGLQFAVYHTFNQLVSKVREKFTSRSAQTGSSTSQAVQDPRKNMEVGPIQSLISGGLAGMSSKSIIYPLDMAKKRMQIHL
ncbi:unnamed protein product [Calicophoron daubneyi]|uniref:Mitochondrial thiamine pyrophosphate carrier n=1 Tax=Calicophoron daubneyi TaxID=300641 RepID=A0AAV2TAH8_CALDB